MFRAAYNFRVFLWGVVAELEYHLYPWKTSDPPQWAVERHNLDSNIKYDGDHEEDKIFYYDWIKSQDEKIRKIEENIIYLTNQINEMKK